MAFSSFVNNLIRRPGEFGIFRNSEWDYDTTDTVATMNTANYFLTANTTYKRGLKLGDKIFVTVWDTSVPTSPNTGTIAAKATLYVNGVTVSSGVFTALDVADGDSLTATDTD